MGRLPDSDDEDTKKDLLLKRKISLEKGRRIARKNQKRASQLFQVVHCKAPHEQIHVSDLLNIAAKENSPTAGTSASLSPSAMLLSTYC